eukprot:8141767-Pyramimonas_sp.AAC.1
MPGAKAQRVDMTGPRDLLRLPDEVLQQYTDPLNQIEIGGAWPPQVMVTCGAMAPKKVAGDRVLGVLPHTARTWSRIRGAASD